MVNDIILKEEIKLTKTKHKQKIPKEISQEIFKKMFKSLLKAVGIMIYFIVLNLAYSNIKQERLIGDIEVFAGMFLVIGIILLEKAYKEDKGSIAISGIEFLVLSLHSLSIMHVITLFKYDFRLYLLTSSYIVAIYYVLEAIILYTKGRKEYLNSLSDISEIVKKEEPLKKEAKKRNIDKNIKKEKTTKITEIEKTTKNNKKVNKKRNAKKKTNIKTNTNTKNGAKKVK